ncbi:MULTISPECIES: hypothetical protein [Clostridium]|uniref:hypothetical protein n=1 Tax=Clostridium TaxID=1485 RepID=UPI000DFA6346|nr:hypothetical protein [Clostridium sporogenes]MCW6085502.1 hypothetical protein [Clostridium sporogenes]STC83942.1 phage protein [Clostridium botulinum]
MIFLEYDKNGLVCLRHYKPFDKINGLNKIKEELEKTGILVESIPEEEHIEMKSPVLYCNPDTKELFYKYVDIQKPTEQILQERIETLEKSNAEMMNLIVTNTAPIE